MLPTDYGQLIRELDRQAAIQRQPINGTFELTERCNLTCSMCNVRHSAGNSSIHSKELSSADWLELASQAIDNGTVFLLLTGGEVFLRPDFFDIYTPLTRLGFLITLFTNGTLITDTIAHSLADLPPSKMEITLYGATAATYETVTGVTGSFARCCEGIETLVKYGVPLGLKTTLTRQNVKELRAMRQLASDWGLSFSADWLVTKRRDLGTAAIEECRLNPDVCIELESSNLATAQPWMETAIRGSSSGNDENFYCQAGKTTFAINPYGEMNPCSDLIVPAALPLQIGFKAAWEQIQYFVDNAPLLSQACLTCDVRQYCPCCPAWSAIETGSLNGAVPYLCEIAHCRKTQYTAMPDALRIPD